MKFSKYAPTSARWVVMGVSGCGKSVVGALLANAVHGRFIEGDAFHPAASIARMAAGIPLDDDDRAGWLAVLAAQLAAAADKDETLVLSCSALKRRYRDLLRGADPRLRFVHLDGPPQVLERRLRERPGHFMPVSLLASQLRDLEPLQDDEAGVVLDFTRPPAELAAACIAGWTARPPSSADSG